MSTVISAFKPSGVTPLGLIHSFREKFPEYREAKIGYAGRLDPMASGVMILLVGDANEDRKDFERLDKDYVFEVLFGVSSDSYDVLGMVTDICDPPPLSSLSKIGDVVTNFCGTYEQQYPPYSAVVRSGKPLHYWARHRLLHTVNVPSKRVSVYQIHHVSNRFVESKELLAQIEKKISYVRGDFRQEKIIRRWRRVLRRSRKYAISQFSIQCSSGVYVRSISHFLGKDLQSCSLAYSITRTRVGGFTIESSVQI